MTDLRLRELLQQTDTLPKLPDTTLRLVAVLGDPASGLTQITDAIRYDQAVTTRLLRLCNSAYFGLSRRIVSLDDAVRYVGSTKLMQLVMAAHTQTLLGPAQTGYGLRPGALWLHSVAVALACQSVAERFGTCDKGVLFTVGLLHDIGKIVLNEHVAREYAQIVGLVHGANISFLEAERRVLGITHTEVGQMVASRWGLPEPIPACIRYHHEPQALPTPDPILDALHLADAACLLLGIGGGDDGQMYRVDPVVLERSGMNATDVENLGAGLVDELKCVQKLFGIRESGAS